MNWKFALLYIVIFMTIRIILDYCIGWHITNITIFVAIFGSLIFGYLERDKK